MYPLIFLYFVHNIRYYCRRVPENIRVVQWANNKFQRYIKLSTPMDDKLHQDSTV